MPYPVATIVFLALIAFVIILGFAAGVNNAWRAIRVFSDQAAKGDGERLP